MSDQSKEPKEARETKASVVSRRQLLAAFGMAGAALLTDSLVHSRLAGADGGDNARNSVTDAVYGKDKIKLPELRQQNVVLAVTLTEMLSNPVPDLETIYYVSDEGMEGHFYSDSDDHETAADGGSVFVGGSGVRFKRLFAGALDVKWFGAKGDASTDDTAAIRAALSAAKGKKLIFPAGVYHLSDSIEIPRNTFVEGAGSSSWHTFGQKRNDLPDSILDMANGTVLKFTGNGSSRYSSNRSDFMNFMCAVRTEPDGDGIQLSGLKILSHFRIRDENNAITTPDTDQHAMYDVGLWINNADHVKLENMSVVGYWQKAGLFIDASGRLSQNGEYGAVEYATISNCTFQGKIGMAVLGGDEGNPPDESGFVPPADADSMSEGGFGLSHLFVSDCFFSGTDHHSNGFASGWQQRLASDSTPLKIDGFIASAIPYRINHPRFVNCSFQTRESASIVLDRVIRPSFLNCRAESGPIRASKHTVLPRLINCEFPYNRTNSAFQEIEHCPGAVIIPPFRRLGQVHLQQFQFQIELRNNNGIIEHRVTKPYAIQAGAKSRDAEAVFRYAVLGAGWNYQTWTATPVPGTNDDFSKGLYLGEKSFMSKYNLITSVAVDNHPDYQEVELEIIDSRAADAALWVRAAAYSAQNVPYRISGYSSVLKIELRNNSGPATNLTANLPKEANGQASLIIRVRGQFYEQIYGLL